MSVPIINRLMLAITLARERVGAHNWRLCATISIIAFGKKVLIVQFILVKINITSTLKLINISQDLDSKEVLMV